MKSDKYTIKYGKYALKNFNAYGGKIGDNTKLILDDFNFKRYYIIIFSIFVFFLKLFCAVSFIKMIITIFYFTNNINSIYTICICIYIFIFIFIFLFIAQWTNFFFLG